MELHYRQNSNNIVIIEVETMPSARVFHIRIVKVAAGDFRKIGSSSEWMTPRLNIQNGKIIH